MKWSLLIARVGGTEVRIHVTFFLLLAFVVWSVGPLAAAFVLTIFLCVLLHEFGHVAAARAFGIRTPDVTLLPIGGLARLERMPRRPSRELVVAVAGPAVNVVIAAVLFFVLREWPTPLTPELDLGTVPGFLAALLVVNLWLVAFNMIPAFPMDGGRVLRALLATRLPYARATRWAAYTGQVLAVAAAFFALLNGHLILLAIAIFIFIGAGHEAAAARFQDGTQGLPVHAAMMSRFETVSPTDTLQTAVDRLLAGAQHDFPVVDGSGAIRGLLTRSDLVAALAEHGAGHPVFDVALPDPPTVAADAPLSQALEQMAADASETLLVVDADNEGRLAGMLTRSNLAELLMVRRAVESKVGR